MRRTCNFEDRQDSRFVLFALESASSYDAHIFPITRYSVVTTFGAREGGFYNQPETGSIHPAIESMLPDQSGVHSQQQLSLLHYRRTIDLLELRSQIELQRVSLRSSF